jgi:hypothetical protein
MNLRGIPLTDERLSTYYEDYSPWSYLPLSQLPVRTAFTSLVYLHHMIIAVTLTCFEQRFTSTQKEHTPLQKLVTSDP